MIRSARNGCSSEINFHGKKIYHDWDHGIPISSLGIKLCKIKWIENKVTDESKLNKVIHLFIDWELYENGWYIPYGDGYKNKHLFYYLQQMGDYGGHRPEALEYLSDS